MKRGYNGQAVLSPEAIAYLHGRIDKEIEIFAASTVHCNAVQLTEKLGTVLLASGIRIEHNVSPLREDTPTGSKTVATLALAGGTHSSPSGMSQEKRDHLSKLAKKRWASMSKHKRTRLLNKMASGRTGKTG